MRKFNKFETPKFLRAPSLNFQHIFYPWFEKLILLELALPKPILLGKSSVKFRTYAQKIVFLAPLAQGVSTLCCFIRSVCLQTSSFVLNPLSN